MQRGTLIHFLQLALDRKMPSGWLFFATTEPRGDSECVVVPEAELDDDGLNLAAVAAGFVVEGLDDRSIRTVVIESARLIEDPPPEDLLVEAFVYYWKYDAALPQRG